MGKIPETHAFAKTPQCLKKGQSAHKTVQYRSLLDVPTDSGLVNTKATGAEHGQHKPERVCWNLFTNTMAHDHKRLRVCLLSQTEHERWERQDIYK